MLNEENKKLCWQVLSKYGVVNQQRMVIEECAELQKAVCKLFRDKENAKCRMNFVEELVDVIVMCQQMLLTEKVNNELLNIMANIKLERALHETNKA